MFVSLGLYFIPWHCLIVLAYKGEFLRNSLRRSLKSPSRTTILLYKGTLVCPVTGVLHPAELSRQYTHNVW